MKTFMKQRRLAISLPLLALLPACAALQSNHAIDGPGMIVTCTSLIEGRSISIKSARLPSGKPFSTPMSFGGRKTSNWRASGATMGAAPDGRELPEWVEFVWQEWPYPSEPAPSDQQAFQAWRSKVLALSKSLPHKTARVPVRSRVPQDVIAEVIEAKRNREPHKLPEKMLWVYFIWYEDGIKFRWRLTSKCCGERSGGDEITTQ